MTTISVPRAACFNTLFFFAVLLLFCLPLTTQGATPTLTEIENAFAAADTGAAKQAVDKTAVTSPTANSTPISVEHEGTDTLGANLAFQLKEIFNSGTLFALSDKDVPKLQILISTLSEFPSRPGVGSLYSVVWVYSERATVLSNYLAHEGGTVTPDNLKDVASLLAARTGGLAARHSYIFNK